MAKQLAVAIVGYGRMGHEVAAAAGARGHRVVATIDPLAADADFRAVDAAALRSCDVAIEFALPAGVEANVARYAESGVAAVVGTTGWDDRRERVLAPAAEAKIPLVYGSNFSVGANLFFRIVDEAARLADAVEDYDVFLTEAHHSAKKDSPSGTALSLAEIVLSRIARKTAIVDETVRRAIAPHELHVGSVRGGAVPGTHTVTFDSNADSVELTHRARSRAGFALGAVLAAEWVVGRPGVWRVDQFFEALFGAGQPNV